MTKRLSATQVREMETLCSALFDGSITPDQFRLLQVYLRISASSRQLFIQHRNLHGALAAACAYEVLPTHTFSGMPGRMTRKSEVPGKRRAGSPARESSTGVPAVGGIPAVGGGPTVGVVPAASLASSTAGSSPTMGASTMARVSSAISSAMEYGRRGEGRRVAQVSLEVATKHVTATSLSIAGLVTVLVLLIMAVFTPPGRRLFEQFTTTSPHQVAPIARLVNVRDCQWLDPMGAPRVGMKLAAGQKLNLASGLAEIRYRNGVQVIVQGPAIFEISRPGQGYLSLGKLSAKVPSEAIGYTVETPNARVVDLGTEFSVEVRPGERSEVHVFRGRVEAQRLGKSGSPGKTISLTAGKAARFEIATGHGSIPTFAANESAFQRTLDRGTPLAAKKTLWREAVKRLRVDPELVLYYTFSGSGSNQREFANQSLAADKHFPCILKGPILKGSGDRGLPIVRGKWPWSAALNFADGSDCYLMVDGLTHGSRSEENSPHFSLGQTMTLVATVGSAQTEAGTVVEEGRGPGDLFTSLSGPILMNRRRNSRNPEFQLSLFSSTGLGQPGKVEFWVNRSTGSQSRSADSGRKQGPLADIVLSEEVDVTRSRWHQIVAVCERLAVRLYWDGNQIGEQLLDEPLDMQLEEILIGRGQSASSDGKARGVGFEGLIDDLVLFKRPLKEAEIRTMAELY